MARINGSGFKMKSSPAKGRLGEFLSNLQRNKKSVIGEESRKHGTGDYARGGSKFDEGRGRMKAGESKYQYDVRTRKATSKAKRSMVDKNKDNISDFIQPHSITNPTPKGQKDVSSSRVADGNYFNFSGKKGDKYKYRTKSYINPYNNQLIPGDEENDDISYEFQRPGSNTWEKPKTKAGNKAIDDVFFSSDVYGEFKGNGRERRTNSDYEGDLPRLKKSGFKMKNSPAKNYKKGYYGIKK